MKPTLNEEIGMSQEAIDYVNSLEVKEENTLFEECTVIDINSYKKLNLAKKIEEQRIKRHSDIVWCCVFLFLIGFVTWYLNK